MVSQYKPPDKYLLDSKVSLNKRSKAKPVRLNPYPRGARGTKRGEQLGCSVKFDKGFAKLVS